MCLGPMLADTRAQVPRLCGTAGGVPGRRCVAPASGSFLVTGGNGGGVIRRGGPRASSRFMPPPQGRGRREEGNVEIKKLGEQQLNSLMKRWLAAPATVDRLEFPARRGSAPRTVMRGLAGHLFYVDGNDTRGRRPA